MTRWHRAAIRRPWTTLLVSAAVIVAAAAGLPRLELRVDGGALVPEGDPAVRADREVRERFGVRDPIAVVVSGATEGAALEPRALRFVEAVTAAFRDVESIGADHVTSLATEKSFRMRDDSLRFRDLLEPVPETLEAVARLRDDLERIGLYQGTLIAEDASATVILIGTPPTVDRLAFADRARALVAEHPLPGYRVDVLGAPVAESLLGVHVLDDLGVPRAALPGASNERPRRHPGMVPVALAITCLVLLAALRRPLLVAVTLGLVGASLVIVLGVMGWLGIPIYLTLAVMPVLLTALGVADAIHILMRLQDPPESRDTTLPERLRASLDELAAPVARTSWTTAAALLSFAVSPLAPGARLRPVHRARCRGADARRADHAAGDALPGAACVDRPPPPRGHTVGGDAGRPRPRPGGGTPSPRRVARCRGARRGRG